MRARGNSVAVAVVLLLCCCMPCFASPLEWRELPPLPEAVSGHAVGAHGGALVAAGGSSFPVPPWEGGTKVWRDGVYLLRPGANTWEAAGQLPAPRAYAGVVSHAEGVYIIGGSDGTRHFTDSLLLRVDANGCVMEENALPPLPEPVAYCGAALVGNTIFIVGGQSAPDAAQAHPGGWKLNLEAAQREWSALPPLPTGGVILPVVGGAERLLVFSGARLAADPDGNVTRTYMRYGWGLNGGEWAPLADTPVPLAAAPAITFGPQNFLVVFGGDDGSLYEEIAGLGGNHPGFSNTVRAYHPITDTWTEWGVAPVAHVATGAVVWAQADGGNAAVVPGGEDRPGHRSVSTVAATFAPRQAALGALDHVVLVVYFVVLVGMGFYFSRRETSTEAFFLGGRKVPWWAVGLSIFGTSLSAITYLSIPATAYSSDWVFTLANMGIVLVAPFVVYFYIPRFRAQPITTAYEYLERRFNIAIRIYGSLCFMCFQTARVGIVLLLPAIALSAATGINVYYCIFAMGVLTTLYTVLGGIEAVIWTDVLQSIVLVFGAVMALGIIVYDLDGGIGTGLAMAVEADKFHTFNWSWDYTTTAVWVILFGNAFSNLYPYTADQTIVQRFLTTKDNKSAARAVWINAGLTIPITILFFSIGTALWVYFRTHPGMIDPTLKNDATLPLFAMINFPAGLKGLLIAAIFAASMSSLDSSINSVASVIVTDYYRRFAAKVSESTALRLAKLVTLFAGAFGTGVAAYMASLDNDTLFKPFLEMLGLVGGGLAGIFALGVFTKRATGPGALAGAVISAGVLFYVKQYTQVHAHLYAPIGFATAFLVGYVASVVLPGAQSTGEDATEAQS